MHNSSKLKYIRVYLNGLYTNYVCLTIWVSILLSISIYVFLLLYNKMWGQCGNLRATYNKIFLYAVFIIVVLWILVESVLWILVKSVLWILKESVLWILVEGVLWVLVESVLWILVEIVLWILVESVSWINVVRLPQSLLSFVELKNSA